MPSKDHFFCKASRPLPNRPSMRVSVIVRTFNESKHLPALLAAIGRQNVGPSDREVIVVDSGSTDRTLEIARSGGCRIIGIGREEFTFGRSLNRGCDTAHGDSLVFISGHCVPVDDLWLGRLIEPLEQGRGSYSYGRQLGGDKTKFSEHRIFAKYFPPFEGQVVSPYFCNNANAALCRDVWKGHPFDETLTGLEDMHLGKSLVEQGHLVTYVPAAAVHHHHDESWRKVRLRYEREAIALQRIMPEVHVHFPDAVRYFLAGMLGDWSEALAQGCFLSRAMEILAFRFCQYYGSWRGNHLHRRLSRQMKEKYFYPR